MLKSIICLANSRKHNHRCIAGKDTTTCEWIRPVSSMKSGELKITDIKYADNKEPEVLDIIQIPFEQRKPLFNQPENISIDGSKWKKLDTYPIEKLDDLCDHPLTIWVNEYTNDRISEYYIKENGIESSLLLIKVGSVTLVRENFVTNTYTKKKVRVEFTYNDEFYDLSLTDSIIETEYNNKTVGRYELNSTNIYLCISLGEPYNGDCYKLVTSIILSG